MPPRTKAGTAPNEIQRVDRVYRRLKNGPECGENLFLFLLGAKYKDDCPKEDYIPIYLIVAGAVLIVRNLSSMCSRASDSDDDDTSEDDKNPAHKCCDSILDLFMFCWFITGNYWIYHIYEPPYAATPTDPDYCNKTLYLFAFWITTCTYIIAGLLCCCLCCIGICVAASSDDDECN